MKHDHLKLAAAAAEDYLQRLASRRVSPSSDDTDRLQTLRSPFPEDAASAEEVIRILNEYGSPATVASSGGRYYGFVNGGILPAALAASWMVSTWDQSASLTLLSPSAAFFEELALQWVIEILGLPANSAGAVLTGATSANFVCICAARHELLKRAGWDAEADGLFGAPPFKVIVGDEVHTSVLKALSLAGLGRNRVQRVPTDAQGRMIAAALPPLDANTLLCLQAGNVNTGAFDPAEKICRKAREDGAWIHVDGAFGLWATASPKYSHLTRGFNLADSWATDGHKWPNVGYDCGVAIVRDTDALRSAMTFSAAYFPASQHRDAAYFGPEMSRRARGVELWAALCGLGKNGLAELIERTCGYAQQFAAGLGNAGFEVLNDVAINQVLVSFGSPEQTKCVATQIQEDGTCWCGTTEWHGRTAMRISVSSWMTTSADVDVSLKAMIRIANAVRSENAQR